jgi:hypothetical protein
MLVSQTGFSVLYLGESDWIQLLCLIFVSHTAFRYYASSWWVRLDLVCVLYLGESYCIQSLCFIVVSQTGFSYCILSL